MRRHLLIFALLCCLAATVSGAVPLEGKFNWQKAEKLCDGVMYTTFSLKNPRLMKGGAVRIDLHNPNFKFILTGRDKDWGKPMPDYQPKPTKRNPKPGLYPIRTRRETCRSFMERNIKQGEKVLAAVNTCGWGPWCPPWNHKYANPGGLIISDGVLVAPPRKKNHAVVIFKNGKVDLLTLTPESDLKNIRHAASGFGFVLRDGSVLGKPDSKSLAPRTGIGLSKDGRYLYLFAIDGRQPRYSMGANTYEVGQYLKYYGAEKGLNMDGGGSTTLLVRKKKKIIKLNHHAMDSERSIAVTLLLALKK